MHFISIKLNEKKKPNTHYVIFSYVNKADKYIILKVKKVAILCE